MIVKGYEAGGDRSSRPLQKASLLGHVSDMIFISALSALTALARWADGERAAGQGAAPEHAGAWSSLACASHVRLAVWP